MTHGPLLDTLLAFLRIPSVSSGAGDPAALREGAAFVADLIEQGGGGADILTTARTRWWSAGSRRRAPARRP